MTSTDVETGNVVTRRYARTVAASTRVRWEIEPDVLRGRRPDFERKFLPDDLTLVHELAFLDACEVRFASQVQGRTYAHMLEILERCIGAKSLEISRMYWFGDRDALAALVRFADDELKHQELFRRLADLAGHGMPAGYAFRPRATDLGDMLLGRSTWAAIGLTLGVELFTLAHYRATLEREEGLCALWKDVLLCHWKEELQHAILHELEWRNEDSRLTFTQRDEAVRDFIAIAGALDAMLQVQALSDSTYFADNAGREFSEAERHAIRTHWLCAYRAQYLVAGIREPRFQETLRALVTLGQLQRIDKLVASLRVSAGD